MCELQTIGTIPTSFRSSDEQAITLLHHTQIKASALARMIRDVNVQVKTLDSFIRTDVHVAVGSSHGVITL